MFSGIVVGTGKVKSVKKVPFGRRLVIHSGGLVGRPAAGDSIAVNGVCLTVVKRYRGNLYFDVVRETLSKTNLGRLSVGDAVNIEPSIRAQDLIAGHFVQGHIDGVGRVMKRLATRKAFKVWLQVPATISIYIAPRGSIAVNGVSLTVADMKKNIFAVALIPVTLQQTNLAGLVVGDEVNIETDILARQLVRYLQTAHQNVGSTIRSRKKYAARFP